MRASGPGKSSRSRASAARRIAKRPAVRDTPSRLLDAALSVFIERRSTGGYTVHAVVAESGISLGSLYHHFGSMDGLSAALYTRSMASLLDFIGDAVEDVEAPRATVTAIVLAYLEFTARHRSVATFIHAAPAERFLPAHAAAIGADMAPRLARIVDALRPHVASGVVVALPEPLLEMLIIGPVAETARRWLAGAPGIDLREASRLLPERIWRAVRA
ncbi:MAG: TetR/AcrR family transcriptional regulator [Labilithrix sp.]|nr:TetR/AcrR family transcriptional regulator [Labilithrix sp.]